MALIFAQKQGVIKTSELIAYQGERDKIKQPIFLTMQDLEKLKCFSFNNLYLERIRDLFLFQCFTGLSYGDLWNDWEVKDTENGNVLVGVRSKNAQSFFIPVQNIVLEILKKYSNDLPKYANAVYNRILKEIVALCGIEKRITTHTARKTFATLSDADGWSRETVSKMLGHKSFKTTEMYYLGESTARIENEMAKRKKGA